MASSAHSKYLLELPAEWKQVPVRALGTVYAGGTPSRDIPRYWNGTIHWVTPAEITRLEGKYLSKTNECITYEGLTCCAAKVLPEGSLLVTTRATIGAVAVSKLSVCTNQGFKNIVPNEISNVDFYYHLFSVIVPELSRLASGSTFPEINQRSFESIIVPRPSKDEQRRIAEILDTIDEAIQKTEALISKLKVMKQGLLHDLLTRGLDKNGKLRDPKAHPEQFKDSPLGRIPKEWKVVPLGKISRVRRGASPRPIDNSVWFAPEGKGWIRISDVTKANGRLKETEQYLSSAGVNKSISVYPGQIIMSICATIGEPIILGMDACIHDGFVVFDQYDRFMYTEFLIHFLRFEQSYFRSQGQTGTQANLNTSIVKNCIIGLPVLNEQKKIADILDDHDSRIRTEEQYRDKLKLQKKGLMHDLLTGKVRVKI
jgi:type I restriction enzyme S subunit